MENRREVKVVLVDASDQAIGEEEKHAAHRDGGKLHRAFSIFLENERGEQLLQQRASSKYHFRGLWANACCGHPTPGERIELAARRRLREELGIDTELTESFVFTYVAEDRESGLTEREVDHVFVGRFDGLAQPHPDEIDAVRWLSPRALERELDAFPERFAPWLQEAAPRVLARPKTQARETRTIASRRRGRLLGVLAVLVAVFWVTVLLRAPWRGHLAQGDSYVTAQALRWLRAWHREGAWRMQFALLLSPPTLEYEGSARRYKWALPGHLATVHAVLWLFELEPSVDRLMQVNLALHLALAVLLALLAHQLALLARPESVRWPALSALGCGLFVLLFPPILYWGQVLSCQYFTVLPFLVVTVFGRWLRGSLPSDRRPAVDLVVALAVFLGTITDFLFWVLVPYLLLQRWRRARRGRPRTSDPWRRTLVAPFLAAHVFLLVVFFTTGQIPVMIARAQSWTIGEGFLFFLFTRVWFLGSFFFGYFFDAFALLGFFCFGLALVKLVRRNSRGALPWMARGVLADLLVPGLLVTFILSPHQATHTVAAMQYVPFVALAWSVLTPLTLDTFRPGFRKLAWVVYASIAFLLIWPGSSRYRTYFPTPEKGWTLEGDFLRSNTEPGDVVFSPTIAIDILPPQRIALAERAVHHVYGPLDILSRIEDVGPVETIALYGPPELFPALGGGNAPVRRGPELALTRVPVARFRKYLATRPDAAYRARRDGVLEGALASEAGELHPYQGVLRAPRLPVGLHVRYGPGAGRGAERLYWQDEEHFHTVSRDGQVVVTGDGGARYVSLGLWQPIDGSRASPRAVELGSFLMSAFEGTAKGMRFSWNGYDVFRRKLGPAPVSILRRPRVVESWDAYVVYADEEPVAMALGPTGGGTAWFSVVFDEALSPMGGHVEVIDPWKIVKRPDAT